MTTVSSLFHLHLPSHNPLSAKFRNPGKPKRSEHHCLDLYRDPNTLITQTALSLRWGESFSAELAFGSAERKLPESRFVSLLRW